VISSFVTVHSLYRLRQQIRYSTQRYTFQVNFMFSNKGVDRGGYGLGRSPVLIGKMFSIDVDFSIGMFCTFHCVSVKSTSIFVSNSFSGFVPDPHRALPFYPAKDFRLSDFLLVPLSNFWLRPSPRVVKIQGTLGRKFPRGKGRAPGPWVVLKNGPENPESLDYENTARQRRGYRQQDHVTNYLTIHDMLSVGWTTCLVCGTLCLRHCRIINVINLTLLRDFQRHFGSSKVVRCDCCFCAVYKCSYIIKYLLTYLHGKQWLLLT